MKNIILIILSLLFLLSCTDKEDEIKIVRPKTTLYSVIVGQQLKLAIEKGTNDYTLNTDNRDILSFEYFQDKEMVAIKTLQCGEASIFVTDTMSDTILIIKVSAHYIGSTEIEEWGKSAILSPEVIVECKDSHVKQLIEDELWNYVNLREGTKYSFNNKTKEFKMNITQLTEQYEGTYSWSIDSLILNYNNITEKYASTIILQKDIYIIQADKTKEYQLLYPQAEITSVKVSRIWYDKGKLHIQ